MKFLVIGLGSMGKRRVRNLIALRKKKKDIAGFDLRVDRREEAKRYGIRTYDNFETALEEHIPGVFIISTPPNHHMQYAYIAEQRNIHCFIEASVIEADKILKLSQKIKNKNILMAPSCTMRYFPMPKKVKELIDLNTIGKVLNINYQVGQYLTDWHPWEKIEDFYVSRPDTGGAREIVPFELTWLNNIFGDATPLVCIRRKITDINADIEDIYHFIIEYPQGVIGNITIEVISRPKATRKLRIIGEDGIIDFDGDSNRLKHINSFLKDWKIINFEIGTVEKNYIYPEQPYINEIKDFIESVENISINKPSIYPNTLEDDYKILQTLYKLEEISNGKNDLSR